MGYIDIVAMSYIVHIMSCNFIIHATYLLTFMAYKYNEFQMSNAIQKLSCKASCEFFFFFIVWREKMHNYVCYNKIKGKKAIFEGGVTIGWNLNMKPNNQKNKNGGDIF